MSNVTDALKMIAQRLSHENVNWMVIASCALALQGVEVDPTDIDIMTDEQGLLTINKVLSDYATVLSDSTPSAIFASTMSKFCIDNFTVEVMSNFNIKSRIDDTWHAMNEWLRYRTMIDVGDHKVPVLPLSHLIELYKLMGRDKDMIKIAKIEQFLITV